MADPFNLVTQYERQLERGREPLQRFDASLQRGLEIGLQSRQRRLQEELLEGKIEEQKQQLSINDQLMQNPRKLIDEFGALTTTEDRLKFIARNAGIAASPMGAKVLEQLNGLTDSMIRQEAQSGVMQAKNARTKMLLELAVPAGVDPTDQEAMNVLLNNKATADLREEFRKNGKVLRANMITPELFPYPGVVDQSKALALMESAEDVPSIDLAEQRLKLAEERAKRPDLSPFGKELDERNRAFLAGRTEDVIRYDAKIAKDTARDGIELETNPDGTIRLRQGSIAGGPSGLQPATRTALEQKLMAQRELNEGLTRLISTGAEKNFGVAGALGSKILDEWVANLPGMDWVANEGRIRDRAKNEQLKSVTLRAIQDERGNLSEGDVRRVNLLLPDSGILKVSPAKARALWKELLQTVRSQARRTGEALNRPELWAYPEQELINLPDIFPETVTNEQIAAELNRRGVPKR